MNNLFHWAMSSYLPYGGFKWLKNVNKFDVNSISKKSPIGYILNVDLEYPELHVLCNDHPVALQKLAIPHDTVRLLYKNADEYEIKVGDVKKLIPNLGKKTNSVLHYRNLQLHLPLRMKLTKIHRVIKFKQYDWMKKILTLKKELILLIVLKIF